MNFSTLVTSSVLARALALLVLALALIAAIVVAMFDFLTQRAVPDVIVQLLYFGLGAALTIAGVNFGIVLQPTNKPETTTQPLPAAAQSGVKNA